jgi:predicted dehydrogenase
LTIAVVGTGSIGRRHLANLLSLDQNDLIAVSEHHKIDNLVVNETTIPVSHDFDALLRSSGSIDTVFICNPSSMHIDYLAKSLKADKNVYLEKPVAINLGQVAELKDFARSHSATIAVGHQLRFHPHLIALKDKIESGTLGRILSVHALQGEHIADYHPGEDYRQSYAARDELGGGVLLTQIHQLDYLNWLLGPFEDVIATNQESNSLGLDVEENVSYLMRNQEGVVVYGHVDFLRRPKHASLTISGTKGIIEWRYYENSLTWISSDPQEEPDVSYEPLNRNQLFCNAVTDFLESINQQRNPRSTLIDGVNSLAIVDAIKTSIATGNNARITKFDELS